MAWLWMTACLLQPSEDEPSSLSLVGTWAFADDEPDAATEVAFADDGTWALIDAGSRCGGPAFESWVCGESGTWELEPPDLLVGDTATLTVKPQGEPRESRQAYFDEPDVFCWDKTLAGTECLARIAAEP